MNQAIKRDMYPLPKVDDLLVRLIGWGETGPSTYIHGYSSTTEVGGKYPELKRYQIFL